MRNLKFLLLAMTVSVVAACSTVDSIVDETGLTEAKTDSKVVAMELSGSTQLYEVHKDGRIYVFYDRELYRDYISSGHTAYMVSRIGAGPDGETMVFALTGDDKAKSSGIPSIDLVDGNISAEDFYGETLKDGRLYIFSSYEMMEDFRKSGEATYRFSDIGSGPAGETVVYVLSKDESKHKPEALIALFKEMQ